MKNRKSDPQYFQNWYAENKEKLAERRAARYRADPEMRRRAQETSRRSRLRKQGKDLDLGPAPPSRSFRKVGDEIVEVFKIGKVADMIGRSAQTIRMWEAREQIPKPIFDEPQRAYTYPQIELMKGLAKAIDEGFDLDAVIADLWDRWSDV
jgi:phosphopentomutase